MLIRGLAGLPPDVPGLELTEDRLGRLGRGFSCPKASSMIDRGEGAVYVSGVTVAVLSCGLWPVRKLFDRSRVGVDLDVTLPSSESLSQFGLSSESATCINSARFLRSLALNFALPGDR
jgi:hypothetical protein